MSNQEPLRQPTQEELRDYLLRMRAIPAGELIMQAIGMIAGGAEAKLGRADARILIDAMGAILSVAGDTLEPNAAQIKDMHAQLQNAQVQLETALAKQAEAEGKTVEELLAEADAAVQESMSEAPQAPAPSEPAKGSSSKLWVPGK